MSWRYTLIRNVVVLAAVVAAAVLTWDAALAQHSRKASRVGYVAFSPAFEPRVEAFRAALRRLHYAEGDNLTLHVIYAAGSLERLDELVGRVSRDLDVLVTSFSAAAHAARRSAGGIPIVTAGVADPVGSGLIASLARPGGNVTGISIDAAADTSAKRVELFKEAVPHMKRLAVLWNVDEPGMAPYLPPAEAWARRAGVEMHIIKARTEAELARALGRIPALRADALFVVPTAAIAAQHRTVLAFAAQHRLPASGAVKWFTEAGGLLSYSVDERALDARAAEYVDRILKGAKPADLPMEQPTRFELVINLRTAKALGLTIPASLLHRADQVIE